MAEAEEGDRGNVRNIHKIERRARFISLIGTAATLSATAVIFLQSEASKWDIEKAEIVDATRYEAMSAPYHDEKDVEAELQQSEPETAGMSQKTADMLLKIAWAEAEGESTEGKALVMRVVLNRVESDLFPDTVEEVLYQPNQFETVKDYGRYYSYPGSEDCEEVLQMIRSGWDESSGALYFESAAIDSWMDYNTEYLFTWGGHKFFK